MEPNNLYHIYNRGNNRVRIFYTRENYLFFIQKITKYISPHVDILAYCLMPNHFHLMVLTKGSYEQSGFSNDLRILLSSYTRAINSQNNWIGSLFQQNTKFKSLEDANDPEYPFTCFHYIHQNPVQAGLVNRFEEWEMSSFVDYAGLRNETICNKKLASLHLDIPETPELFIKQAYGIQIISEF